MDASTVTVAVWNIEADGGRSGEHRHAAIDLLASLKPDVFLQQEAKYSRERGEQLKYTTEKQLRLRGFLSSPNPFIDADIATSLYLRPEMFQVVKQKPCAKTWYLHPCHVQAQLGDCPIPLNLASFHMCSFDAGTRLTEAGWLTTLAQPGMVTIAAGDTNSYPHRLEPISLPVWEKVTDRAHMVHRTVMDSSGIRRSDTGPDHALIDAEYVDLARHAADHLGSDGAGALAATAGFRKPQQGGPQRIDRGYAAGGAATALEHVEVIEHKDFDHALLLYRFNRTRLERMLTPSPRTATS